MPDKPEDISPTTNIGPAKSIQPGGEQLPKPTESFESFMKEGKPQGASKEAEGVSPFDLAGQGRAAAAGPTNESILSQMNSTSSVLGDLQTQLNNKNLNLRQSQKYLLRNKIKNAHELIETAAKKAGADLLQLFDVLRSIRAVLCKRVIRNREPRKKREGNSLCGVEVAGQ